jgi:hypothetical protein
MNSLVQIGKYTANNKGVNGKAVKSIEKICHGKHHDE